MNLVVVNWGASICVWRDEISCDALKILFNMLISFTNLSFFVPFFMSLNFLRYKLNSELVMQNVRTRSGIIRGP